MDDGAIYEETKVAKDANVSFGFTNIFCILPTMKFLIFGSTGYLGSLFRERYPDAVCPKFDIADSQAVAAILDAEKPDVVINAAGKTGRPNVDWCEEHKLETLHANVTGPLVLLEECSKRGVYWVHIGSGCIYQGDNGGEGFSEEDPPNFSGSYYSHTKLMSDQMLQNFPVLNIRLRMPFDGTENSRSLITKVCGYTRVLDAPNSLTYLPDLLDITAQLINQEKTGTFNVVNPGAMSPYEVMLLYKEIVDPSHEFERLTVEDLPEVARTGRSNCLLSTAKLRGEGLEPPPVEQRVREALEQLRVCVPSSSHSA